MKYLSHIIPAKSKVSPGYFNLKAVGSNEPLFKLTNYSIINDILKKDKSLITLSEYGEMNLSDQYVTNVISEVREFLLWMVKIIRDEPEKTK